MSEGFGVQYSRLYGTHGEFSVPAGDVSIKVKFVLSKIRPGTQGNWENELASRMRPWREVFNVEKLSFDELLQRDLDDSRVAHDLIPYLIGDTGSFAKFFPPILAVLVPRLSSGAGIEPYYPEKENGEGDDFNPLFRFGAVEFEGQETPLGKIEYNPQRAGFVIVDGQHRAMALLALHRQLNDNWGSNSYASYYAHLTPTGEQVSNVELPVCVIYFPELHGGATELQEKGVTLPAVCRELFLVVNRTAKRVSHSRELLLDDEDFAARMMRNTLSKLKDRDEDDSDLARIYSFAFGDSSSDAGKAVVSDKLDFSTAVALHRIQAAVVFGSADGFSLSNPEDISDLRRCQNVERPTRLLIGTDLEEWPSLSRRSAKRYPATEAEKAVKLLGSLVDAKLFSVFDGTVPFTVQNQTLRELRTRLSEPDSRSDPVQNKCHTLLFEGSGVRGVFEDHLARLETRKADLEGQGKKVSDHIEHQIEFAKSVKTALVKHESWFERRTSAKLFNLDEKSFFAEGADQDVAKEIVSLGRTITETVATQAYQLGHVMAVAALVDALLEGHSSVDYKRRMEYTTATAEAIAGGLNDYFSDDATRPRRERKGLVDSSRARVFDQNSFGLRGLLRLVTSELNERQWPFFQYAVLEISHSKYSRSALAHAVVAKGEAFTDDYLRKLPDLVKAVVERRNGYIDKVITAEINDPVFKRDLELRQATLEGEGRDADEIEAALEQMTEEKKTTARDRAKQNLTASLGELESARDMEDQVKSAIEGARNELQEDVSEE